MGMFDTLTTDFPLPDPEEQGETFQTKDFMNLMARIRISDSGEFIYTRPFKTFILSIMPTTDFIFYRVHPPITRDFKMSEYRAHVEHGRIIRITRTASHWKETGYDPEAL